VIDFVWAIMNFAFQNEDVNECNLKDEYPCYGVCTNTLGSYKCECPPGTSGDAAKNNCRPKDKFTAALKAVTCTCVLFDSHIMQPYSYLSHGLVVRFVPAISSHASI
jgi:hypothetical protein